MAIISVRNFTKNYAKCVAVNNISFDIEEGTIVGFVGKNGAGKSTTIRALLNFINPTKGSLNILNLDSAKDARAIRDHVSYMPSDANFYPRITTKDLLGFYIKFTNNGFEEVQKWCNYFELDMNKKISELSLGNRKKVSIIQALLKDAKLLILDEPTSGLDPLMQERFFNCLLEKKKQGVTIFLSSHNLSEIEKYCDRTIIIKDGMIIDDIDMSEALNHRIKTVTYETIHGTSHEFEFEGEMNDLISKLATIDLTNLEIKNKSIEDNFKKYYKEDN